MAAAITLAAVLGITSAAASTLVETTNGWVQGKTVGSVDQWLGIRYAASTAGVGRWTPPNPPGSYGTQEDPYAATQFGAPCPQNISQFGNSIPLPTPPNTVPVPGSADSEDCLFPASRSATRESSANACSTSSAGQRVGQSASHPRQLSEGAPGQCP